MTIDDEPYDVVTVALERQINILKEMDRNHFGPDGIMQQIHSQQIHELNTAIRMWKWKEQK